MTRPYALTILAMLVASSMLKPVAAQEAKSLDAAATAEIRTEVSNALAGYSKLWDAHDAKGVAENAYTVPSFVVLPNGDVIPSLHTEDIAKTYSNVMKQALAKGWARSALDVGSICVLNANTAFASAKGTRYRADGSVLGVVGETLVYVRTKAGWRIAGLIVQQPNKVVTCND